MYSILIPNALYTYRDNHCSNPANNPAIIDKMMAGGERMNAEPLVCLLRQARRLERKTGHGMESSELKKTLIQVNDHR